jgi:hypothetical protein
MGILDRDYAQEHIGRLEEEAEKIRRATFDPEQHRRAANPPVPPASPPSSAAQRPNANPPLPTWWQVNRWNIVGFMIAVGVAQWLGLSLKVPALFHSTSLAAVTPPPVVVGPTAKLRIIALAEAGLTAVDLTDVATHGTWSFKISRGQTIDYGMPPGDYRVRVTHKDKWGSAGKPVDMPEIAHFAVGQHGESGTWTISLGGLAQR